MFNRGSYTSIYLPGDVSCRSYFRILHEQEYFLFLEQNIGRDSLMGQLGLYLAANCSLCLVAFADVTAATRVLSMGTDVKALYSK
jgi:hypothetical protein